jgi:hypothetical protein
MNNYITQVQADGVTVFVWDTSQMQPALVNGEMSHTPEMIFSGTLDEITLKVSNDTAQVTSSQSKLDTDTSVLQAVQSALTPPPVDKIIL